MSPKTVSIHNRTTQLDFSHFNNMRLLLMEWENLLKEKNSHSECTLMGGACMGLIYQYPRFTHDLDLAITSNEKDKALLAFIGPNSVHRKKLGCYIQYVDDGIFFNAPQWKKRRWALTAEGFAQLSFFCLSPEDLIISKMGDRFNSKDQEDIFYLLHEGWIDPELLWALFAEAAAIISDSQEHAVFLQQAEWIKYRYQQQP